jgi:hypothetical protein
MTPPLASATPGVGSLRLGRRSGSGRRDGGNARLVFILGRAIIIAMELNAAVYDRYGNLPAHASDHRLLLGSHPPALPSPLGRRERPERTVLGDVAVQGDAEAPDADH